jgi:hypothetical protein
MSSDHDKKKIGEVTSTNRTRGVRGTEQVSEVEAVRGAGAVDRVLGVQGIGKTGGARAITSDQRDRLMSLVAQEAEKLAKDGSIPKSQRGVVERAVKMVIEAALLDGEESNGSKKRS